MQIRNRPVFQYIAFAGLVAALGITVFSNASDGSAAPKRSIGTVVDDSIVSARVKSALIADPAVNGFDFKIATRKGEVQISGFADSELQVERAITIARSVEGVKSIDNKVALKNGAATIGNRIDDGIATASVKSALLAEGDAKGLQIGVVTRKGIVQLSGFVDDQAQADRAIAIARGTDYVQGVSDEMSIKK